MDPTKRLEDEQTRVLDKILQASHQEEIIHQYLKTKAKIRHYNKHRKQNDISYIFLCIKHNTHYNIKSHRCHVVVL